MAIQLGSSSVTLKLGTQAVTAYLGAVSLNPTVPGAPTIDSSNGNGVSFTQVAFAPPSSGGSPITAYRFYFNDSLEEADAITAAGVLLIASFSAGLSGNVQVSAVNAVGEGPLSEAVAVILD
jgi:hypothetical protein